ncbi:MAG: TIGR03619 family F420-dependent LLM class oxidoreductase [Acidimicrobiales bacterium]|nr:TIGR03619 family F420-dependent LLM class oxidoreductase [Acidimicrobiales bacterium]
MKVSLGLPVVGSPDGGAGPIGEVALAAERVGFGAVHLSEHPFPPARWVAAGGHHALDPLVGLAVAAGATTQIGLHTNLLVAPYRNPFAAAKALATLDLLSGGRLIVGVGTGYLRGEFAALGADFDRRNDATDEAIAAWRMAWTGQEVRAEGPGWRAAGNVMLPTPRRPGGPPVWIGGNAERAVRRAVELGDGWSPFPTSPAVAIAARTSVIADVEDLTRRVDGLRAIAASLGRRGPFDLAFVPAGIDPPGAAPIDLQAVAGSCERLAAIGVSWVTVALPGANPDDHLAWIESTGRDLVAALGSLVPVPVLDP